VGDELVFTVEGNKALAAQSISLADAGLKEREHLQEWVLAHPHILGQDVLVVTSEFDRWTSRGGAERDRLDILGLDSEGRLVVAELKRDVAPDTVEMQAIKYAAMASRFDIDALADAYREFHGRMAPRRTSCWRRRRSFSLLTLSTGSTPRLFGRHESSSSPGRFPPM
jgi:hypothetical protein